jgi:hypothetical protein
LRVARRFSKVVDQAETLVPNDWLVDGNGNPDEVAEAIWDLVSRLDE